jgi:hypothetical protein
MRCDIIVTIPKGIVTSKWAQCKRVSVSAGLKFALSTPCIARHPLVEPSLGEVKDIRDRAFAMQHWARQAMNTQLIDAGRESA